MGGFLEGRYDNGWEGGWHRFDGTWRNELDTLGLSCCFMVFVCGG